MNSKWLHDGSDQDINLMILTYDPHTPTPHPPTPPPLHTPHTPTPHPTPP